MLAAVMADSSVTYQLVSIPEATTILRLSESSVRRLVKAGRLEAEQVQRPQGHVRLVKVPAPSTDQVEQPPSQIAASGDAPSTEPPASTPAEAMTALVQTTIATVLGPLVAEQAALRQIVERLADQLVQQAQTIRRVTAERDAIQQQHAAILAAHTSTGSR